MPITAKLSQRFYAVFGDDVVNELVDLLNLVDANSRSQLREFNELNFARSDAKHEQRTAKLEAKLDQRFVEFEAKLDQRFAEADAKLERCIREVHTSLLRWMFVFGVTMTASLAGLMLTLFGQLR